MQKYGLSAMSKKVRVKLNIAGLREFRRSGEVTNAVENLAGNYLNALGSDFYAETKKNIGRSFVTIKSDSFKVYKDNLKNNTVLKKTGL